MKFESPEAILSRFSNNEISKSIMDAFDQLGIPYTTGNSPSPFDPLSNQDFVGLSDAYETPYVVEISKKIKQSGVVSGAVYENSWPVNSFVSDFVIGDASAESKPYNIVSDNMPSAA